MKNEIWKDIPGYGGKYQVSSLGRVKSFMVHEDGSLLSGAVGRNGYRVYNMRLNSKQRVLYAHRLVLEAFVGPCPKGMVCRHLNGDRQDNRAENLAWGTQVENMQDAIEHGTAARGSRNGQSKLTESIVEGYVVPALKAGAKATDVAERLGVSCWSIYDIRSGRNWIDTTGGALPVLV